MKFFLLMIAVHFQQTPLQSVSRAFEGSWIGTLEYRNYSGNGREKLGTLLRIYKSPTENGLEFRYVYDDGPKKVIQDEERVELDETQRTYVVFSVDGQETDRYTVSGLAHVSKMGFGTFSLLGKATENGVLVDVRETLKIRSSTLDILRESKLPGKSWLFRHEYLFKRVEQPRVG